MSNPPGLLSGNALVTGAGSGIGRQLSLAYARAGVQNVTLADVNAAGATETEDLIQAKFPHVGILKMIVDVTDEASVNSMVDKAVDAFKTLDYAANAAGVVVKTRAKSAHYPIDDYDRVMNINARGVALCMLAEAKAMLRQQRKLTSSYWEDDRRAQVGSIVNICSVNGLVSTHNVMSYTASKHAVMGMTRAAAIEHGEEGLRVNAVCPGVVETPLLDGLRAAGATESSPVFANPMGRLCLPDEIADACVYLSSTMSSYVNGAALVSDGGRSVEY